MHADAFSKFTFSRKNLFIISSCCVGDPFMFLATAADFTRLQIQPHPPAHPPPQATAQKREREAIDFPETDERAAKFQKG